MDYSTSQNQYILDHIHPDPIQLIRGQIVMTKCLRLLDKWFLWDLLMKMVG